MIKNYIKIAFRNLQRNRVYSLINIAGLTIGMAACLLVATVVIDDLSYDRQWKNADNIYRVITVDNSDKNLVDRSPRSFTGLGPSLKVNFPEVKGYCRMVNGEDRYKLGDNRDGVSIVALSAEPSVWNMLDFSVVHGNPKKFVPGYPNLVITEKIRKQYFADGNPIGKTITDIPDFGKAKTYIITGIIKDIPSNTHLRADMLVLNEHDADYNQLNKGGFGTFTSQYILLKPGTSVKIFSAKVNKWYAQFTKGNSRNVSYEFQPMTDVYLKSDFGGYQRVQGKISNVYIFSGIAVLLLIIACINFINLTTARALKRIAEVGIRKVLGAAKADLIAQFLFESILFFVISFAIGIFVYSILLNPVENYLGYKLTLTLSRNIGMFSAICGVVLLVSLLTGLYPALLLSGRLPATALKGNTGVQQGSGVLRKALVVVQFTISVAVLICTIVVQKQLKFIINKDLGYDKNNLLRINETDLGTSGDAFKQEVLKIAGVENASISTWYPSGGGGFMTTMVDDPNQKGNKIQATYIKADVDLVSTLKLQLQKGRLFSNKFGNDALNSDSLMQKSMEKFEEAQKTQPVLITAYTAQAFNIKELNKPILNMRGIPVGIIKDFNNESLKIAMSPTLIVADNKITYGSMLMRVQPGSQKQVLTNVDKLWKQFFPGKIFEYRWVNDLLQEQYKADNKLQQLFTLFSFLIAFMACMGLFGLATFTAEQRIKEIGIRKVLGASVTSITTLLSIDFVKLVLVAIIIAAPIAWLSIGKWLQTYAYRIKPDIGLVFISGTIAVVMALIAVGYHTIKAATANPVKSLKSE
ncbi:FtsX-like permease family protein [Mucilaginibacter sp. AW1-7]|uniref:ABC transporter permease n=1 Tax=Mucilaginibacter sp. AW1-7 TaxID=3349874 RepID=UPI003F734BDF